MTQGNIATWQKKEGEAVAAGDILAEIETDKATIGFDSQEDGYLAKILLPDGTQNIPVGTPVAVLVEDEKDVAAFANYVSSGKAPEAPPTDAPGTAAPAAAAVAAPAAASAGAAHVDLHSIKIGPATRFLMTQLGLSPSQITATGSPMIKDMITKGDVLAAVESGVKGTGKPAAAAPTAAAATAAPKAAAGGTAAPARQSRRTKEPHHDETNSAIRKIIAARLLESKTTIPHMYMQVEANLDAVMQLRKELKDAGHKVSVNDCVIKAAATALAAVPEANNFWSETNGISPSSAVDISMAVSTDKGLITPIIKGADQKSLLDISADAKRLAGKARDNKLTPDEFQGGTFSISNLGMFPVDQFCAIINPPQAAIMAVGRGVKKVVLKDGKPATTTTMVVTISADHRVYQGGVGHKFLAAFKQSMEAPANMLVRS